MPIDSAGGEPNALRKLGATNWFQSIGTLAHPQGAVATVNGTRRLVLIPLDGSAPIGLPSLQAPRGMTIGDAAAAAVGAP